MRSDRLAADTRTAIGRLVNRGCVSTRQARATGMNDNRADHSSTLSGSWPNGARAAESRIRGC